VLTFHEIYFTRIISSYISSSSSAAIAYSSSCLHELLKQHINLWTLLGSIGYSSMLNEIHFIHFTRFISCYAICIACCIHEAKLELCFISSCTHHAVLHQMKARAFIYLVPSLFKPHHHSSSFAPGIILEFTKEFLCKPGKSGHGSRTFCEY
jgi:hypothetical protein